MAHAGSKRPESRQLARRRTPKELRGAGATPTLVETVFAISGVVNSAGLAVRSIDARKPKPESGAIQISIVHHSPAFRAPCRRNLMNATLLNLLKELVIVPIINVNANEYRTRSIEGLFEYWLDLVRGPNQKAMCSEGLGVFHWVDRA